MNRVSVRMCRFTRIRKNRPRNMWDVLTPERAACSTRTNMRITGEARIAPVELRPTSNTVSPDFSQFVWAHLGTNAPRSREFANTESQPFCLTEPWCTWTPRNPDTFVPHTLLVCCKTGMLPQIGQCRAGTVFYR